MKKQKTTMSPEMLGAYNATQRQLDYLIMATPTGKAREFLTEANIQLMRARQEWEQKYGKA